VVDVASGAWHSDRGKIRDHAAARVFHTFCERGYVVLAARPGSRNRYTLAEMAQHVRLAVLYARRRAEELGFEPGRLGLMGASAGGHLALLASLAPHQARPQDRDPLLRLDGRVKATAAFFPPTDFLDWSGDGKPTDLAALRPLFFAGGGAERTRDELEQAAQAVSPLHRVARTETPFLLIHGDADAVVPLSHSQRFAAAMKEAGNSVELIVKAGGGHPWPTIAEEVRVAADWFDRRL
jgi:acetyl esterase/lipase